MKQFGSAFLLCIASLLGPERLSAADLPRPAVVAHRGLLLHAPENTLANFRACLELRIGFEFDVARTKDGQLVCIHDETVDRTTNGKGKVAEMTLEEIRRLDAGKWFDPAFAGEVIPTVDEVFQLVAAYPKFSGCIAVDLKAEGVEKDVVRLAEKHQVLDQLLFIGRTITMPEVRKNLKAASLRAQTAAVANNAGEFKQALKGTDVDWIYFRFLPSKAEMDAVRAAKKRSFIAGPTVSGNNPDHWKKVAAVGVEAILTDYPLELATMLRKEK